MIFKGTPFPEQNFFFPQPLKPITNILHVQANLSFLRLHQKL